METVEFTVQTDRWEEFCRMMDMPLGMWSPIDIHGVGSVRISEYCEQGNGTYIVRGYKDDGSAYSFESF